MLRLGLCCTFRDEPIRFRRTTAAALGRLEPQAAREKLAGLIAINAAALGQSIEYCAGRGIGAFRINSQILPLKTHPALGYSLEELPDGAALREAFRRCGEKAKNLGVRLSFHPDQFVVLGSPDERLVASSIAELDYQAEVAEWSGADVINIHAGGAYGDKPGALERLRRTIDRLPERVRRRLTLENDDRCFTPRELWPVCRDSGTPLCYDAHHHRCLPDGWNEGEATEKARETWDREPLFHISSPLNGWGGPQARAHHDQIDFADFPKQWLGLDLTVEVEAKAKEAAVVRLRRQLIRRQVEVWPGRRPGMSV